MPRIPGVNHLDAVRALERARFQIVRQGKHIVMSDGTRQVTVPLGIIRSRPSQWAGLCRTPG
jgi:predicted RNA binding protein YcfA (HicA-like mRNA interferase family)